MSLLRNGCSTFGSALRVVVTRGVTNKSFNSVMLARPFSASAGGEDSHKRTSKDDDALAEGEILLYKGSQLKPILLMLSVSAVNVMYFGSQIAHYFMYKNVVVEGVSLAGDPFWGIFGSLATGGIIYFTRTFAHSSIYQAYETEDHQRIGFQTHTLFGKPGRKFEVPLGNVRFIQKPNQLTRTEEESAASKDQGGIVNKMLASSYVPMKVDGFGSNVIVDVDGHFADKARFVELVSEPTQVIKSNAKEMIKETPVAPRKRSGKKN